MRIILGIMVCTIINLAFYKAFNSFWGGYFSELINVAIIMLILEM